MSDLAALHAAICAAPDDEAPRRAYAAAVRTTDPDRARLIDLQLANRATLRAGGEPTDLDIVTASRLQRAHGARWAGPIAGQVEEVDFAGGFVEAITLPAATWLARGADLCRLAPIRWLTLTAARGHLAALAAQPLLARIVGLDLAHNELTDDDVRTLLASAYLRGLRYLRLTGNPISGAAVDAIARADLPALSHLNLAGTDVDLVSITSDWNGAPSQVEASPFALALRARHGDRAWLSPAASTNPEQY
jgi:hypothetical protein